ncbi:MAG: hypothetical protein ACKPKO_29760, partial [Candidatus Fonsibacter sp.]
HLSCLFNQRRRLCQRTLEVATTVFSGTGNNSNLLPTITDFTIAVDGNNQYNPSAEYRLIDMHSAMNLNRIDIIV